MAGPGLLGPTTEVVRLEGRMLRVTGVVQGVGFRPFVYRQAVQFGLTGWVRNTSGDVQVLVEGLPDALDQFAEALRRNAPPMARIEGVESAARAPEGHTRFQLLGSQVEPSRSQPVAPDTAICHACVAELFDPADRRYRYPFVTCTDCGPRYTIIEGLPYDRVRTSMQAFPQCPDCFAEYHAPADRRYHSETNACAECGPVLWFEPAAGALPAPRGEAALASAVDLLRRGLVLAVRGLGGFHLAVDATREDAVRRLRVRKHREAKPLALMVAQLADAERLAVVTPAAAELLTSPECPIVLLPRREGSGLALSVAPGLPEIGVMLAATPLHHLMLMDFGSPLVMTSGNRSEDPIAISNAEARLTLGEIADGFLLHDREIVARYDDSVVRMSEPGPIVIRRARGYAPLPVDLPVPTPVPLVAVGPHLKNTFTLAEGGRAWPSQHIGDLETLETLHHFQDALARGRQLFRIDPQVAVRDLHPGYLSTRLAQELGLERVIAVQHHHAHVAAVLAEHGQRGPVLGLTFDGTGYGTDGRTWGAELLWADLVGFRRLARLRYAALPGGDLAARRPWRSAVGYLALAYGDDERAVPFPSQVLEAEWQLALRQIARRINAPEVSSMGRLFDAAAALLGVRYRASYEGQAAMELEALAGDRVAASLPTVFSQEGADGDAIWVWDPVGMLVELAARHKQGEDPADLAAIFHETVAAAAVRMVILGRLGVPVGPGDRSVALCGGSFQNARLTASVTRRLVEKGIQVLFPRRLSPNDGAVSLGQAAVAAAQLAAGA
jgi:hydrogenase maturation protein HypF